MASPVTATSVSLAARDAVRWEGRAVRADAVAARMLDLRQAASDEEGYPMARASVMNLLVYAASANQVHLAVHTVDELALRHPSRAIVVAPRKGRTFSLDADVVLHRHPLASHGLVFERAMLRVTGASPEGLDTLVIPLLIPHLQSYLWWLGDPDPGQPALRSLVGICDRLIIDSSLGPVARLREISAQLGPTAAASSEARFSRLVLGDTEWARLDSVRQILAQVFDEGHRATYLEGLTRVEITGARPMRSPLTSAELYLAGWIASRVGCTGPQAEAGEGLVRRVSMALDGNSRRLVFRLGGARGYRGGLGTRPVVRAIRIEAELGRRRLQVEVTADGRAGRVEIRESGAAAVRRTMPMPTPPESEVLSREVARPGRDRVFEDSMVSAARIVGALAG